jgi:hypothetical protein
MKAAWSDDETLKKLLHLIKDSPDKIGLMSASKGILMKTLGLSD